MNRVIHIIFSIIIGIIAIKAAYMFFDDNSRLGGIVFSMSAFVLGLPVLQQNISDYRRLKNEADKEKAGSSLVILSKALGFILAAIAMFLYVLLNWEKLQ